MKIKDINVFVCCPGRNFVTVKVITEDGVYGLGDATLNGREMAVVAYLEEHLVPCLVGRDAHQIEDIWQYLYKGAYWQNGSVSTAAIAAIDMALWDIKGKVANLPFYQLLGGNSRKGVTVYGHANGADSQSALGQDALRGLRADHCHNWLFFKAQCQTENSNGRMNHPGLSSGCIKFKF